MAISRYFIAKKTMPFGDLLLLKKQWRFGYVLLLNICWQFGDTQLLRVCGQFCINLLLNIDWQFWQLLIAYTETIDLVAFIRLEGVNYVSHTFLLF
jgi:hypothetical protein